MREAKSLKRPEIATMGTAAVQTVDIFKLCTGIGNFFVVAHKSMM